MERYNYLEEVTNDVINWLEDNKETVKKEIKNGNISDLDELANYLNEELISNDSVTGNASGSYTFNTWQAEENICHNLDLLGEALTEFGCDPKYLQENGAEAADVTIRCFLLSEAINAAIEQTAWTEEFIDKYSL